MKYIVGETYIIDAEFNNGGKVKLIAKGIHFCKVECLNTGEQWETCLRRLYPLDFFMPPDSSIGIVTRSIA